MARNAQKRAAGGKVYYAGGASNVAKEAKGKTSGFKSGGKVGGEMCAPRMDKRARGGSVKSSAGGGSADKKPFSSAKC